VRVATSRIRPTRDGIVAAVGGVLLGLIGFASGNNLLYLVAAPVWAMVLLAVPLGWWNLRGLEVRRALPPELYAGREAAGRLLLRNGRPRLSARAIRVVDEGTGASGTVTAVLPGTIGAIPVRWRFGDRGPARLSAVTLSSRWPFGFADHSVVLPAPAELVVYPRPLPVVAAPRIWPGAVGPENESAGIGTGDFLGLRPYRPGDSPRTVHWPTTARVGALQVVERAGETEISVEVEVRPFTGLQWERELSVAVGEVHRALQLGRKVGLALPAVEGSSARRMAPAQGATWRRTLLETLALLPRVP
jgi:uncharacterized protein (DUF58 family)